MSENQAVDPRARWREVEEALAAPFDPREVKFKPQAISGKRALAVAYVDARTVQDRLDDVLGPEGWSDDYQLLPDGNVVCRLRVRLGDEWIQKTDVGGQSEQPDDGDRMKSAFSDALKRAAVKLGIARYLYRLPQQWADYDPQKKQFVRPPTLPAEQTRHPKPETRNESEPDPQPPAEEAPQQPPPRPKTPEHLRSWLDQLERYLVGRGLAEPNELVGWLFRAGAAAGLKGPIQDWPAAKVPWASQEAVAWAEARKKERSPATEEDRARIKEELARTGRKWADVLRVLKLNADVQPESLDRGQARRALDRLAEEPDAPARGRPAKK